MSILEILVRLPRVILFTITLPLDQELDPGISFLSALWLVSQNLFHLKLFLTFHQQGR